MIQPEPSSPPQTSPLGASALPVGINSSAKPDYRPLNLLAPRWNAVVQSTDVALYSSRAAPPPWMYGAVACRGRRPGAPRRNRALLWLSWIAAAAIAGIAGYSLQEMDQMEAASVHRTVFRRTNTAAAADVQTVETDVANPNDLEPAGTPAQVPATDSTQKALQLSLALRAMPPAPPVSAAAVAPTWREPIATTTVPALDFVDAEAIAGPALLAPPPAPSPAIRQSKRAKPRSALLDCSDALKAMQLCEL
jgi:hypothetical protein